MRALHLLAVLVADPLSLLLGLGVRQPLAKTLALLIRHELLPVERLRQGNAFLTRACLHACLMLGAESRPFRDGLYGRDAVAILAPLLTRHDLRAVDVGIAQLIAIFDMQLQSVAIAILKAVLIAILKSILVAVLDAIPIGDAILVAVLNTILIGDLTLIPRSVAFPVLGECPRRSRERQCDQHRCEKSVFHDYPL